MSQLAPAKPKLNIRIEASCVLEVAQPSGVGRFVEQLIESLIEHPDVEVELVCGIFPNNWVVPNKIFRKLNHYLPDSLQIPIDIFRKPVDATLFPNFSSLRTLRSRRRMVLIHDLVYKLFPETVEEKNLTFLTKEVPRSLRTCDTLITTTQTMSSLIKDSFGASTPRTSLVIPIPPAKKYFDKPQVSRAALADKYNFPDDDYIYFIGNMEPRKNLSSLINAYIALSSDIKKRYSLVIAGGQGWRSEQTRKQIEDSKARGERIYAVGYVDEVDTSPLMHHASLHCLPSIDEGFGLSIYQAMAASTPVVTNGIPIIREIANDYAILTDASDPTVLASSIRKSLLGYDQELISKANEFVRQVSWQEVADKVVEEIRE